MVASRSAEILFVLIFIPLTKSKLRMSVLRRHVTFSRQLQVQEADHSQEAEKAEEEGRKAACGFGEIGENCDFTSPRKRPSPVCCCGKLTRQESLDNQAASTQKTPSEITMTDLPTTFCSSRILPGQG